MEIQPQFDLNEGNQAQFDLNEPIERSNSSSNIQEEEIENRGFDDIEMEIEADNLEFELEEAEKGEQQLDIEDQVRSQCNFNNEGDERQITLVQSNSDLTQADTSISTTKDDLSGSLIGYTRATLPEIYDLYCEHACIVGFSVRKSTNRRKHGSDKIIEKEYVCSAAGKRNSGKKKVKQEGKSGQTAEESTTNVCQAVQQSTTEDCQTTEESKTKTKKRKRRRVAVTRTNCHALIKAKLNSQGQFEITEHSLAHNHPLTRQQWNHLHRSERMMTSEKGSAIKSMQESGLRPMESFRYMLAEAGGEQFIGHTVRDHLNYCNKLKMKPVEGGDAQAVIDKLYQKVADDMEFFFRVRLDHEGKVCSIFWRDSMMKEDYSVYGDVTIFDTTYRTNRYNLICAPFTGINNHWKNTMFGCAFLGDEKIESFVWLFETFKKSMGGKCPITIFTDQDTTMSKAIEKVFPDSRHRLCLWHLNQNAVSRFGALKRNTGFKDVFQKCLSGCSTEEEFEKTWHEMVVEYKLEKSKWFNKLYKLKEKWATALSKDFFSAGILSSQRSESTNRAIGFKANKRTSLNEFFEIYEATIKRWRGMEEADEFKCSMSIPSSNLAMCGLVKHAAELYTHTLFRDFEVEFETAMGTEIVRSSIYSNMLLYEVRIEDDNRAPQQVVYMPNDQKIRCTCRGFEETGLLCYHSIRILHLHSVKKIPEAYITTRWTKNAKKEVWDRLEGQMKDQGILNNYTPWRLHMVRKFYNLILKSHTNEQARKVIEDSYKANCLAIDPLLEAAELNIANQDDETQDNSENSTTVLDPARSTTKGRNKRIKGHYNKHKNKKKQKNSTNASNSSKAKEFGAKTPKHLI